MEAGFPAASNLDFEIVQTIASQIAGKPDSPIIAGLCQLREEQVERTIQALLPAVKYKKARMHVYLPVDPDLMPASLGERCEDKNGLIDIFLELCATSSSYAGLEVEFSPEGYSRMGKNFDFVDRSH